MGKLTMNVIPGNSLKNLRLITFDVTGTLLKFVKPPVQQYVDIGRKHGVFADESTMSRVFKQQWQEMNQAQPNYGTCWRSWWTEFVVETFKKSKAHGVMTNKTLDTIASDLIDHFTTAECWEAKPGAEELLKLLLAVKHFSLLESKTAQYDDDENCDLLPSPSPFDAHSHSKNSRLGTVTTPLQIGVLSNFDSRLEKILQVTNLHPYFDFFITSHECQVSKPHRGIFDCALLAANNNNNKNKTLPNDKTILPHEALHIGDSYDLDYVGAKNAGWNSFLVLDSVKLKEQLPPDIHHQNNTPPFVFANLNELGHFFKMCHLPLE